MGKMATWKCLETELEGIEQLCNELLGGRPWVSRCVPKCTCGATGGPVQAGSPWQFGGCLGRCRGCTTLRRLVLVSLPTVRLHDALVGSLVILASVF